MNLKVQWFEIFLLTDKHAPQDPKSRTYPNTFISRLMYLQFLLIKYHLCFRSKSHKMLRLFPPVHPWRPSLLPCLLCPQCHTDFLADHGLLSSASLTPVIQFTLPFLSNWSNFPPWLWWMCPTLTPCPSTLVGLIKENIPWLPIFPRAWQPIILPSTWLETYYA